ncbi:tetratricopeptide repeat protein [Hyunsoonleella ulvae]|uniref:hypothetical protein n=1 Tax=Hyunsoonleella ulvae TaxID=2799948 RepID=UPI001EF091BB|nr:hypothetical protein [Hyunsoonleella ulvae]
MHKLFIIIAFIFSLSVYGQNEIELDDKTYSKIEKLSKKGDKYVEIGNYKKALEKYWEAYNLIPEPKTEWETTTWLLVAIGDANFLSSDFKDGADNFRSAMNCPGGIGNPFLHLRLGQCQYENGNLQKAADELTKAYAMAGEEIFEDEDSKYFEFLKTKIEVD